MVIIKERTQGRNAINRWNDERNKKRGPQVLFDCSVELHRRLKHVLGERVITLRNSGEMKALDVSITHMKNGAYSADIHVIPRLMPKQEMTIQVEYNAVPVKQSSAFC